MQPEPESLWRQSEHLHRKLTQRYHVLRKLNYALTRRKKNREALEHTRYMACLDYLDYSLRLHKKSTKTLSLLQRRGIKSKDSDQLTYFIEMAGKHINLVMRRVIDHEYIAHSEKVFSLFEPHTEWINKGKAGVPVELGLRVCVLQDQFGFTYNGLSNPVDWKGLADVLNVVPMSLLPIIFIIIPCLLLVSINK